MLFYEIIPKKLLTYSYFRVFLQRYARIIGKLLHTLFIYITFDLT